MAVLSFQAVTLQSLKYNGLGLDNMEHNIQSMGGLTYHTHLQLYQYSFVQFLGTEAIKRDRGTAAFQLGNIGSRTITEINQH